MNQQESIELSDIWLSIQKSKKYGFIILTIGVVCSLLGYGITSPNIKVVAPIGVIQKSVFSDDIQPDAYWRFLSDFDAMNQFNSTLISELSKKKLAHLFLESISSGKPDPNIYLNYIYKRMTPFLSKFPQEFAQKQLPFYFYYNSGTSASGEKSWSIGVQTIQINEAYLAIQSIGVALQDAIRIFNSKQSDRYKDALTNFVSNADYENDQFSHPSEIFNPVFNQATKLIHNLKNTMGKDYTDDSDLFSNLHLPIQFKVDSMQQESFLMSQKYLIERMIAIIEFNLKELEKDSSKFSKNIRLGFEKDLLSLKTNKNLAEVTSSRSIIRNNAETARSTKSYQNLNRFRNPLPELNFSKDFEDKLKVVAVITNDRKSIIYYLVAGCLLSLLIFTFIISRNLFRDIQR